jgi:hypothetical protein
VLRSVLAASLLLVVSAASTARADDDTITVHLKNGAVYHGELVEKVPESHVTVKLATGEVKRFEWDEIEAPAAKPKAAPKSSEPKSSEPKSNEPKPSAPKSTVDEGPTLDIDAPSGLVLQRHIGTSEWASSGGVGSVNHWQTVCKTPCEPLATPGTYRVDGPGIPSSASFDLQGEQRIKVSAGNSVGYVLGQVLWIGGGGAALSGAGIAAIEGGDAARVLLFGGLAAFAVGMPLWLFNRTTVQVGSSGVALSARGVTF